MNGDRSLLLMGIGGAGSAMARGVERAFGEEINSVLVDTDALSGDTGGRFVLLGGERLSGRSAGGDVVRAKVAAEDSIGALDEHLEGVRMAIVVTALGGGTGSAATLVVLKRLASLGIASIVFATTPFSFEGDERQRNSRSMQAMVEDAANASFILPLDGLVAGEDNMERALARAVDSMASGVTLFWRMLEKPGYIRFDAERLRRFISGAGRGRFATATAAGEGRAARAAEAIKAAISARPGGQIKSAVIGILAGDDLRLSEVGEIAESLRADIGALASFEVATVNDEATFSGRVAVVAMLFESSTDDVQRGGKAARHGKGVPRPKTSPLGVGPSGRGRFANSEPTIYNGEDLDIPTFVRQNITLDV